LPWPGERKEVLAKLYKEKPEAKAEIEKSKGYAVFSSFGMNLLVVSTARGGGILKDMRSGKETYMSMFSAGGGLGLGVKDFGIVFVFKDEKALDEDSEGAEAAATVVSGVEIYQITDKGLALQATLQGTKYWKNDDLN
jgi:lipid-binding SYLF domain-containing protein